jgi:hypothetical protein
LHHQVWAEVQVQLKLLWQASVQLFLAPVGEQEVPCTAEQYGIRTGMMAEDGTAKATSTKANASPSFLIVLSPM